MDRFSLFLKWYKAKRIYIPLHLTGIYFGIAKIFYSRADIRDISC